MEELEEELEIDLSRYFRVIVQKKRWFLIIPLLMLITFGVNLLLPKLYRSTATILPLNNSVRPSLESYFGVESGRNSGLNLRQIQSVMQNSTFVSRVISRIGEKELTSSFSLEDPGNKKNTELIQLIRLVRGLVAVELDQKLQGLTVSSSVHDPSLSALLVKAYVDELGTYLGENALHTNFLVLNEAHIPVRPHRPRVVGNTLFSGLFGFLISFWGIFFRDYLQRLKRANVCNGIK